MFVRNNFSYTNIDLTLQKRVETYIKRSSFGLVQKETFIETLYLKKHQISKSDLSVSGFITLGH